jgi:predicted kinase
MGFETDISTSDNTNADIETRKHWVQVAQDFKIPIRLVRFTAAARLCEHNDSVRALNSSLVRTHLPCCHTVTDIPATILIDD